MLHKAALVPRYFIFTIQIPTVKGFCEERTNEKVKNQKMASFCGSFLGDCHLPSDQGKVCGLSVGYKNQLSFR